MRKSSIALVSVLLLSLFSEHAEADANAQDYGAKMFQSVLAGDEKGARWFLLSTNEAQAVYAGVTQGSYKKYIDSNLAEMRQLFKGAARLRQGGTTLKLVGVNVARVDKVAGGKFRQPNVVVTVRPVWFMEGKGKFVGDDMIRLVGVNKYWKLANMDVD